MYADPVVVWISALAPAAILGAAACSKLADLRAFRAVVADYSVLPAALVAPVACCVAYMELGAAVGLLFPGSRPVAATVALLLLAILTGALAVNLLRGRRELDCGCHFGRASPRLSGSLLLRNALLMLWVLPAGIAEAVMRPLGWLDGITIVSGSALGVLAYVMGGELLALRPIAQRS